MTQPNILLIVLDATRADVCSCYGADRPATPHLDALAAGGTLYEQAISPAPWTLPAFASLFTGLYPSQLGIYGRKHLSASLPTLATLLSAHGYGTFGITNNSWLSADFGLQRGFGEIHKLWQIFQTTQDINRLVVLDRADPGRSLVPNLVSQWLQGNPLKNVANTAYNSLWSYRRDYGARRTLRPLVGWLERQKGPWFAFVHYLEAHLEFKPPDAWALRFARDWERVRALRKQDQWRLAWRHIAGLEPISAGDLAAWQDLYLAEVAYADHHMGHLLQSLRQSDHLEQTLVVVTADHGESLGEHGLVNHQYCVYDTLLRVPLVIHYPPAFPAGKRVPWQVQTHDLFATLLEVAGIQPPPSASRSLVPEQDGPRPFTVAQYGAPRLPHASLLHRYGLQPEQLAPYARGLTALRTEQHKLIASTDGSRELYDWSQDPGEEQDLAASQPDLVSELEGILEDWQQGLFRVSEGEDENGWLMDPTTAARLRALGYID